MKLARVRGKRRAGFTLVELLVVILIIAVLMSLLLAGVMKALGKGGEVRNLSEIRQLTAAVEAFKSKFGIYPPSRMYLSETGNYDTTNPLHADSLRILTKMFPRYNPATTPTDWNGNGRIDQGLNGTPNQGGDVILEGDQCLVFFLGGIPSNLGARVDPSTSPPQITAPPITPSPSVLGFSTNPLNPAYHVQQIATNQPAGDVIPPFHEFKSSQLVRWLPNTAPPSPIHGFGKYANGFTPDRFRVLDGPLFFSYLDTYAASDGHGGIISGGPYAYFSSGNAQNGYNRMVLLGMQTVISGNDCYVLGVWPFAEEIKQPLQNSRYLNPSTFQILSPGKDGLFGQGTVLGNNPPTWTPSTAANSDAINVPDPLNPSRRLPYGADDQSNFHDRTLSSGN